MAGETADAGNAAGHTGVMKLVHAFDAGMNCIEKPIMFIMSLLLFAIITWGVIARYFLYIATPYQEELSTLFHIWLVFFGVSSLTGRAGHPAIEMLSDRVKKGASLRVRKAYFTVIYAVMLFFVVLAFIYGCTQLPNYLMRKSVYLQMSYIFTYGGGVLGMLFISVRCLLKIIEIWVGGEWC